MQIPKWEVFDLIRWRFHSELSHVIEFEPELFDYRFFVDFIDLGVDVLEVYVFDIGEVHHSFAAHLVWKERRLDIQQLFEVLVIVVDVCLDRLIVIYHKELVLYFDLHFYLDRSIPRVRDIRNKLYHLVFRHPQITISFLSVLLEHLLSEFAPSFRAFYAFRLTHL